LLHCSFKQTRILDVLDKNLNALILYLISNAYFYTMTDILIIGSGIAGLSLAVKTAEQFPDKKIIVLTKANEDDSNTQYAQG